MLRGSTYLLSCVLLATAPVLLGSGCQKEDGPTRYQISGTVTYKGTPVPGGSIVFTPDSKKGNAGPQGTARIINGHYDTSDDGRGTVSGPHQIHVIATESTETAASETEPPLAEYIFEVDIPAEAAQQDLDIPSK